jgi:hypothetical protein
VGIGKKIQSRNEDWILILQLRNFTAWVNVTIVCCITVLYVAAFTLVKCTRPVSSGETYNLNRSLRPPSCSDKNFVRFLRSCSSYDDLQVSTFHAPNIDISQISEKNKFCIRFEYFPTAVLSKGKESSPAAPEIRLKTFQNYKVQFYLEANPPLLYPREVL